MEWDFWADILGRSIFAGVLMGITALISVKLSEWCLKKTGRKKLIWLVAGLAICILIFGVGLYFEATDVPGTGVAYISLTGMSLGIFFGVGLGTTPE